MAHVASSETTIEIGRDGSSAVTTKTVYSDGSAYTEVEVFTPHGLHSGGGIGCGGAGVGANEG